MGVSQNEGSLKMVGFALVSLPNHIGACPEIQNDTHSYQTCREQRGGTAHRASLLGVWFREDCFRCPPPGKNQSALRELCEHFLVDRSAGVSEGEVGGVETGRGRAGKGRCREFAGWVDVFPAFLGRKA